MSQSQHSSSSARGCRCGRDCSNLRTIPARIPWLPLRQKSTEPFCQSAFYDIFILRDPKTKLSSQKSHETAVKFKLDTLLACDCTFPYYLPGRYHNMDSFKIRKSPKSGLYWINVNQFVRTAGDYGTLLSYKLVRDMDTVSTTLQGFQPPTVFLQNEPEVCRTAADFLLEPWVLIQLPSQPALFHQWAVAVLASSLHYSKFLVRIGSRGYAPKFRGLFKLLTKINHCLLLVKHHLFQFLREINGRSLDWFRETKYLFKINDEWLGLVVSALEFVFSDYCKEILDHIMFISWHATTSATDLEEYPNPKDLWDPDLLKDTIYDLTYWTRQNHPHPQNDIAYNVPTSFEADVNRESITRRESQDKEFMKGIVHLVWDHFGFHELAENSENCINQITANMDPRDAERLLREVYAAQAYTATSFPYGDLGHSGIIVDMLSLHSDLMIEKASGSILRQQGLAVKQLCIKMQGQNHLQPAPLTRIALDAINDVKKRAREFTLDGVFERAQASSRACYEEFRAECEEESAAALFTFRIRELVLKMHKKHYETMVDEQSSFHPESLVAHYVLPCFVATYLDVSKDAGVDAETKEDCKRFVAELISSYEDHEFVQVFTSHEHKKAEFLLHPRVVHATLSRRFSQFETIFRTKLRGCASINLDVAFMKRGFKDIIFARQLGLPTTAYDSLTQINRLFCRMQKCLEKIGWIPKDENAESIIAREILPILVTFKGIATDADKILECRYLNGKENDAFGFCLEDNEKISKSVFKNSAELTTAQLLSISVYETWSHHKMSREEFFRTYQGPLFTLDAGDDLAGKIVDGDWWGLKKMISSFARPVRPIPLALAKRNLCCRALLKSASRKVKPGRPGEVSFFPVQHCRWCGTVYSTELRLCAECEDEPDYPDPTFFCSEKCETDALSACHAEEHATFLMEKLGIC